MYASKFESLRNHPKPRRMCYGLLFAFQSLLSLSKLGSVSSGIYLISLFVSSGTLQCRRLAREPRTRMQPTSSNAKVRYSLTFCFVSSTAGNICSIQHAVPHATCPSPPVALAPATNMSLRATYPSPHATNMHFMQHIHHSMQQIYNLVQWFTSCNKFTTPCSASFTPRKIHSKTWSYTCSTYIIVSAQPCTWFTAAGMQSCNTFMKYTPL